MASSLLGGEGPLIFLISCLITCFVTAGIVIFSKNTTTTKYFQDMIEISPVEVEAEELLFRDLENKK